MGWFFIFDRLSRIFGRQSFVVRQTVLHHASLISLIHCLFLVTHHLLPETFIHYALPIQYRSTIIQHVFPIATHTCNALFINSCQIYLLHRSIIHQPLLITCHTQSINQYIFLTCCPLELIYNHHHLFPITVYT